MVGGAGVAEGQLTLNSSLNPTTYAQTVKLAAGLPDCTYKGDIVDFYDGSTLIGSATLTQRFPDLVGCYPQTATFTTSNLAVGPHSLSAVCCEGFGEITFPSNTVSQTVNFAPTTNTLTPSPNPSTVGQTVTLTASVTCVNVSTCPTGTVTFLEGPTVLGHGTLAGGVASFSTSALAVGSHNLTAAYLGDPNFSGSSGQATQVVSLIPTATGLSSLPNPSTYSQPVTLKATVSPPAVTETGTVTFFDGGAALGSVGLSGGSASLPVSNLATGMHNLTATYSGDANYSASMGATSQTVSQIQTTTSLMSSANPSTYNQPVMLTANVSPAGATGTVTFSDGASTLGVISLSNGSASFTTSNLTGGSHSLSAAYSGDTNYTSSTSGLTQMVNPASTNTSLSVVPSPGTSGQTVTLTATVTPGDATGTVTFKDGASTLGASPVSGGSSTFPISTLAAGGHVLTAVYSGDTNYASSTSPAFNETVASAGPRTITSLSPTTAAAGGASFQLTINGTGFGPDGAAQWNGAALATSFVSATQVTATVPANLLASPGTVTITVVTGGGTTGGAPFTVNAAGQPCSFTLTTPSASFGAGGGSGSVVVTASRTDCTWTGTTTAPWITGFNTVTGSGTLRYNVGSNSGTTSRAGAIAIGAQTFNVIQGGTGCRYSLPFGSQAFGSAGGGGTAIVRAPPGCVWTATSAVPWVTVTPPGSGSGDGSVAYTVMPNATAGPLVGIVTIANHQYTVIQQGTNVTQNCTASVPNMAQAALEGRTEMLGDLVLNCSGMSGVATADITLALNTNATNTLTGNVTDAVVTVNGGAPVNGLIGGYNSLRWFAVPIVPAADGTASLRISKVRADASILANLGNPQPVTITGQASLTTLSRPGVNKTLLTAVPVTGAMRNLAVATPSLLFTKSQAIPPTGGLQTLLPVLHQETSSAAFQAGLTRLHVSLTNVPGSVQVYAPVYPAEGVSRAQLYSADASGAGGSPVAGSPMAGGMYQPLTITGGKATATWLVLAADPTQVETFTFTLLLQNPGSGDLNVIQVTGSLAPVSDVTIASGTAPALRYRDLGLALLNPVAPVILLVDTSSSNSVAFDMAGSNVSTTTTVTNDSTNPSTSPTNVMVSDNVPTGETVVGCTPSPGATCSQSGNQVVVDCGTLAPGQSCSATVTAQVDPSLQGGSPLDNSASALSDQPNLDVFSATSDSSFVALAGSPATVAETPASGTGSARTFTFQYSHPSGYEFLNVVNVLINNFLDGRSACYLAYSIPLTTLYLVNDAGQSGGPYAGALALGDSSTIQNSQCAVNLVSAVGNGNTLTLTLSIAFKGAFGGNRIMYVAAGDQALANTNWQALGVWQPPFTPAGTIAVTGGTPSRGAGVAGTSGQFMITLTDTKGTGDFGVIDVLINNFLDGRKACYLAYSAPANTLFLVDDAGEAGGPFAGQMALNGGNGSIGNGQCVVTGVGSAVSTAPSTLTLTLNIAFTAAFTGNRVVYVAGRDRAEGNNTDWQAVATWTVQ